MPIIKTLNKEETRKLFETATKVDLGIYLDSLGKLRAGQWAAITPGPDETLRKIKRRLTIAAKRLGKEVQYREISGGRLAFTTTQE